MGILGKILRFPLTRLVMILVLALLFGLGLFLGLRFLKWAFDFRTHESLGPFPFLGVALVVQAIQSIALLGAAWVVARFVARRSMEEFNPDHALSESAIGIALGVAFITTVILLKFAAGWYTIEGTNAGDLHVMPFGLFAALALFLLVAFAEELLFRGVLFRLIEEMLGSVLALLASALLFGFVHGGNPNATVWSSLAISLEAGIMLGAMYMMTGRLWMVIGTHWAWNFCLGSLYGSPVSGMGGLPTFLRSQTEGPDLWTGGRFGPEAGLPAILLGTLLSILFLAVAHRRGRLHVLPVWWKQRRDRQRLQTVDQNIEEIADQADPA